MSLEEIERLSAFQEIFFFQEITVYTTKLKNLFKMFSESLCIFMFPLNGLETRQIFQKTNFSCFKEIVTEVYTE